MSEPIAPVPPTNTTSSNSSVPSGAQINSAAAGAFDLIKNRANYYLSKFDKELAKQPYCNYIERRTGIPKTYIVLGTSISFFFMIFFNLGARLLTNAISWIYPAYASFKAIESPSTEDDTQWLTYWTVIGFFQMIEYFSDILLYWFPFYFTFKTLIVLWLILPQFRGAEIAYKRFLRPFLLNAQPEIERHAHKVTDAFKQATSSSKTQ